MVGLGSSQDLGRLPWLKAKAFAGQNENQLPIEQGREEKVEKACELENARHARTH